MSSKPPSANLTVVAIGEPVGDNRLASLTAKLLNDVVGIVDAKGGSRAKAALIALLHPDGTLTFLVGAHDADGAGEVLGLVYQAMHATIAAYEGTLDSNGSDE
jgi:hypothetical protein